MKASPELLFALELQCSWMHPDFGWEQGCFPRVCWCGMGRGRSVVLPGLEQGCRHGASLWNSLVPGVG